MSALNHSSALAQTEISSHQDQDDGGVLAALRVLATEAKALNDLQAAIDQTFAAAITTIESAKGRVIVTGMGKSGHVARKIAATMASTGTPAFFVHPAESSHGDLGMITRDDVVLALSNSGEVKELGDLIEYTRRFAIPLICMTSRAESTLAKRSDVALVLPPFREACPNGQAPTTSTTLMMALGDALAIALLERKGFSEKDFRLFHPGGKLGQQMMRVAEIMHQGDALPIVDDQATTRQAIDVIGEKGFGCVGVVDAQGFLKGILTDGDIRRHISPDFLTKKASDVMTQSPRVISSDALVAEAMAVMNDLKNTYRKITVLFVTDAQGKPVGLLHIHDCLRAGFG